MALRLFNRKGSSNPKHKQSLAVAWPDYSVTLDNKNFNSFIQNYPLSMIDF